MKPGDMSGLFVSVQVREGEVMAMMNKFGQEYICFLPAVGPLHSDFKHDDDILDQLVDISGGSSNFLSVNAPIKGRRLDNLRNY